MRKNLTLIWMLALILALSASGVFGQSNPKANYLEFTGENQSRNIPAGVVMDPASHLTYLIDTGYNLREGNSPDVALQSVPTIGDGFATNADVFSADGTPGSDGIKDMDQFAMNSNFITITNTHPTMAVTIHFRYFNDNCDDILDFLIVLTCNDTLVFNPFDFVIPDTGGENTKNRLYFKSGAILQPMTPAEFGSGRFLITAAASATSIDGDDDAEILFPSEYSGVDHCNIESDGTLGGTLEEVLAGDVQNKGDSDGLVWDNLHVFNANQMSFNYLIGSFATAVPGGQNSIYGWKSLAYGVPAWGRPAVDRWYDWNGHVNDPSNLTGYPDGDGPAATTGKLIAGGEILFRSNRTTQDITNTLSLRNDVHGGDIRQDVGTNSIGGHSEYGALATTSFMGDDPDNIIQHFMSVADDYNGSSNTGVVSGGVVLESDRTSNIVPAATTYVMQLYDNDEDLYWIEPGTPLNVSPPVVNEVVELKLVCICLRTFLTTKITPGTNVDSVTITDLNNIFATGVYADDILNGGGAGLDYDGFLLGGTDPGDLSHGWIRWVRDLVNVVDLSGGVGGNVGLTTVSTAHNVGSSTFDDPTPYVDIANILGDASIGDTGMYPGYGPSLLTQALQVTVYQPGTTEFGYGVANWEFSSASDCLVSETGKPEEVDTEPTSCSFPQRP